MVQRISRNSRVRVVGAMRRPVRDMLRGRGGNRRLAAESVGARCLRVLRAQFPLSLQPMGGIASVGMAGLLPDLVCPMGDFRVGC